MYRNIRHMEGRINAGATKKLISTVDNITKEHTDKKFIESLIINENERNTTKLKVAANYLLTLLLPHWVVTAKDQLYPRC